MSTDKSTNKLTQIIEAKRQKQLERENKEKWIRDELLKMGFEKESLSEINLLSDHEGREWYIFDSPDYCIRFLIYIGFDCKKAEVYGNFLSVAKNSIFDEGEYYDEHYWPEYPVSDLIESENGDAKELLEKILASIEQLTPTTLYPRSHDPYRDRTNVN
ncbi:hypothetical protein [Geminocystis herdmanii]|uniref:hypothetical protein n=1 Tax=Geminocystis herdmanii TaxID=669359 RepID=UPI00034D53FF|nr:hypothetical protein [Geminocystis herdmanii]